MNRNLLIGVAVIAAVAIAAVVSLRYFKSEERVEIQNGLAMPTFPETRPSKPALRRIGPEPSYEVRRRCMEKHPRDNVARLACEKGLNGITNAELDRRLDNAWNEGLSGRR